MGYDLPNDLELKGQIVDLKPTVENDWPVMKKILSDEKTMDQLHFMAHLEQGGWTDEQIKEREEKWNHEKNGGTSLHFTIWDKNSKSIAGCGGLKNMDSDHQKCEFGIILHHEFWSKGISIETLFLCLEFVYEKLKVHRVEMSTFVTNTRACRFLEKFGIQREHIKKENFCVNGEFIDDATYVVFDREWPELKAKLETYIQTKVSK